MSDRRAWRLDLAASLLLCAGLLVGLAILSQGPADLPTSGNLDNLGKIYADTSFWIGGTGTQNHNAGMIFLREGAAIETWS